MTVINWEDHITRPSPRDWVVAYYSVLADTVALVGLCSGGHWSVNASRWLWYASKQGAWSAAKRMDRDDAQVISMRHLYRHYLTGIKRKRKVRRAK